MPALSDHQLVELTRRQHRRILAIRATTVAQVLRLWDRLEPVGEDAADRFATSASTAVVDAQEVAASTTAGYLTLVAGSGPARPPVARLRGVDSFEVYHRPVVTVRRVLSEGRSLAEALGVGRSRLAATAATDVMLAQRATIDQWTQTGKIVGYRRVLTGNSCLFCAAASTQRYHARELMPLHSMCDCGVAPITDDRDPGRVINEPLLRDLKARGPGYWAQRGMVDADGNVVDAPAVHRHGELGPVLAHPDHKFTGPDDL